MTEEKQDDEEFEDQYIVVDVGRPIEIRSLNWNDGQFSALGLEGDDVVLSIAGEIFRGTWQPSMVTDIIVESDGKSLDVVGTSETRLNCPKVFPILKNVKETVSADVVQRIIGDLESTAQEDSTVLVQVKDDEPGKS